MHERLYLRKSSLRLLSSRHDFQLEMLQNIAAKPSPIPAVV